MAENTVPATTATTASRPGTCLISRSTPSMTLMARPVWNSTSPISTNSGIGVSEKFITETTLLRTTWARPASPPRNSQRADDVDGHERQRHRHADQQQHGRAAQQQQRRQLPRHVSDHPRRAAGRRHDADTASVRGARSPRQPVHAEQELDREQQESHGQRRQQPPLRRHQRLDGDGAGLVARGQHLPAVPDEIERAGEPQQVAHPFQQPAQPRRQRAQQDIDADVLALPQQPGRRQQRQQIEDVLRDLAAPGDAAETRHCAPTTSAPMSSVMASSSRHASRHQAIEQAAVGARQAIHRRRSGCARSLRLGEELLQLRPVLGALG